MQTLQIELSELELSSSIDGDYILIKKGTGTREDREDSEQLEYTHLLSNTSKGESIRVYLITVLPLAVRKPISTNANELVYVLSGSPTYTLKGNEVTLDQGDLLFFDGTVAHGISNKFNEPAVLLKVYLLH
ncbi:hypothetical protein IX49_04100 [Cellulophaga lytica]|nr:cupin domain-containing protein [Cellulophaga lytica]AIM59740.1 hypothetical protein IX49_04100 [Cellulophaga lytica]